MRISNHSQYFCQSPQNTKRNLQEYKRYINPRNLIKDKFFISGLSIGSLAAIFLQLISNGIIFSEKNTGEIKLFRPLDKPIKHLDTTNNVTYIFPKSNKDNDNCIYIVVFGMSINWHNAKVGGQVLANIVNGPTYLVHNGSSGKVIDLIRSSLNRIHCWLFGLGHEKAIHSTEKLILNKLTNDDKQIVVVGHSAGASTVYSAIRKIIREHPEMLKIIKSKLKVEFWGSPEFIGDMTHIGKYCKTVIITRKNDHIAAGFQSPIWGGLALPAAIWRVISALSKVEGSQHRAILYLKDFMEEKIHDDYSHNGQEIFCQPSF